MKFWFKVKICVAYHKFTTKLGFQLTIFSLGIQYLHFKGPWNENSLFIETWGAVAHLGCSTGLVVAAGAGAAPAAASSNPAEETNQFFSVWGIQQYCSGLSCLGKHWCHWLKPHYCQWSCYAARLGMSLRKVTLLGSNLASLSDLKRIETPYSLCSDWGGYKTFTTRWSGGRVQVESKFEPLPVIWQIVAFSPKAVPEGNRRFRGQNQRPSSWGSSPGEHKHRTFPSWRQSLRAATGSLEENMLPLLRYWLSSRAKKVLMLCKFRAATSHFFFSCEMKISME